MNSQYNLINPLAKFVNLKKNSVYIENKIMS